MSGRPRARHFAGWWLALALASGATPAQAAFPSEREVERVIALADSLDEAQRFSAADSVLFPLWQRVIADSSKRPGTVGRVTARRARLVSSARVMGTTLKGGWTPGQCYDWLSASLRWLSAEHGPGSRRLLAPMRTQAEIARDQERYGLADSLGRAIVRLSRKLTPPSERQLVNALVGLAATQGRAGDYRASIASLDTAIVLSLGLPDPTRQDTLDLAVAYNGRASAALLLRTDESAESDLQRCLALREQANAPPSDRAQVIANLGIIAYRRGDAAQAAALYARSAALYRLEPEVNQRGLGWSLTGLASSELELGRPALALRWQREAIAILEESWGKDHRLVGRQYLALANILRELGDPAGATRALEHALGIFDRRGGESPQFMIQYESQRAGLLRQQGRAAAAESLAARAIARTDSLFGRNARWRRELSGALAEARLAQGDSAGALAAYRERYDVAVSQTGAASWQAIEYGYVLATWPDSTGRPSPERARAWLASAEQLGSESLVTWGHDLVARAQYAGGAVGQEAATTFAHALAAERGFRERFELAVRGFTSHEAIAFERSRPRPLDVAWRDYDRRRHVGALTPAGVLAGSRELWEEVLRSRARVFDELAARRRVPALAGDSTRAALEELQRASTALAALVLEGSADTTAAAREQLRRARERRADAERALAAASESFRAEETGAHVGLAEVERTLGASQALVAFARFGAVLPGERAEYVAFVRGVGGRVVVIGLGDAVATDSLLARWLADLSPRAARRGSTAWRVSGAALRRRLWDPLAPALSGAAEALLVPDGALASLPWLALPVGERGVLLDRPLLLRVVASERDLIGALAPARGVGMLALGGAAFADPPAGASADSAANSPTAASAPCDALHGPFAPLPGTLAEIADVTLHWRTAQPAESVLALRGSEASEREFRALAPGRRVLHVATHAFRLEQSCETGAPSAEELAPGGTRGIGGLASSAAATSGAATPARPAVPALGADALLRTGLLLAGADHAARRPHDDDGVLSAEEVAALDLRGVELAVLSGCGTGLGETFVGEGTLGLERAFRVAGARATLGALWPVDDLATRSWMRGFYAAGGATGGDAALAARAAARELRAAGREHPFWWAAFRVLEGVR